MTEKEIRDALEWVENELVYWENKIKDNPNIIEKKGMPKEYLHLTVIKNVIKEKIWRNQHSQKDLFQE